MSDYNTQSQNYIPHFRWGGSKFGLAGSKLTWGAFASTLSLRIICSRSSSTEQFCSVARNVKKSKSSGDTETDFIWPS